ncbi:MAG TPA: PAS domain S-box protein [Clostridiaceae bacterium]|nr:PAS domain S-box protein [Clostridiaceae bacterium]
MRSNIRNSGIEIIRNIPWGTHIAQLYSSKEDLYEVLVPFVRQGLIDNELCLWIYAQNSSYKEVKNKISVHVEDIDYYLESGQLKIVSYTEWYVNGGSFNEIRVNRQWKEIIRHALDNGHEGIRVVADASWLGKSDFAEFSHYEYNANKFISELPFIAICLYDINKVDIFEVTEIIKNHSYVIASRGNGPELIKNMDLVIKDKQLVEYEETCRSIFQLLPDSFIIHDANKIYYCNDSAVQLTGTKDFHELSKMSVLEMVPNESKDDFLAFINKSLKENMKRNYLVSKFIYNNSEIRDVEIISTGYDYKGNPALFTIVRDITPFTKINELEKDLQENVELSNRALEYDKIKMEFFSNISHEFRTPLNVILSAVQLIKSQAGEAYRNTKIGKYIKAIQQNCYRLLRLVNNLIDITEIDLDYYHIKLQNYDIVSLVENITMSVVEYARNKNITITFDTNIEEKIIACDPDQIERIILNLLSNSIKFTNKGGNIWVTVCDYKDKIQITVKDTGIGIPPEEQESIFDKFKQIDKSLRKRYEGSGIGLSLVKALVEKHNGKVTLNSQPGKGSEFIIEIPCKVILEPSNMVNTRYRDFSRDCIEKVNIEFSDIYM